MTSDQKIKAAINQAYGRIARSHQEKNAGSDAFGCCSDPEKSADAVNDVKGLGCGNPLALDRIRPGDIVLDLGCGGGFECFQAARLTGAAGSVIGVDMVPEMIALAKKNAAEIGTVNVDFRLGEIERLPVDTESVDLIISNCVINLVPDKSSVFKEAFRVLRPGGRLSISDIVAMAPIPKEMRENMTLYAGCISGAACPGEIRTILQKCGFEQIDIHIKESARRDIEKTWHHAKDAMAPIAPADITARKPLKPEMKGELQ